MAGTVTRRNLEAQIGQLFERHKVLKLDEVRVVRFTLPTDCRDEFRSRFGLLLAGAYLMPLERQNPDAQPQVPSVEVPMVRRGDFGEALAKVVYDQLLEGYSAPGSKLWGKPNPDTSQTGEDRVALFASTRSLKIEPVTVESKVRTTYRGPQALLDLFQQPVEDRNRTRVAAWRNTVRDLSCAGLRDRNYSYLMAKLMFERSTRSPAEELNYHLHGFLVVEPSSLSDKQILERWSEEGSAHVDRLVVVEIDDLAALVDACFEVASNSRVRDLAPHLEDLEMGEVEGLAAGLSSPIVVDAAEPPPLTCPVSQSALWYLADRDGLAAAVCSELLDSSDPYVRACAELLSGHIPAAPDVCDMGEFVEAVRVAWFEPGDNLVGEIAKISNEAEKWIGRHSAYSEQMRLVAAALASRLSRHPRRLLGNDVVPGGHLDSLTGLMVKKGLVALWPPQARTISAGLVAGLSHSFIVSLPTSGGKTLLIAISIAKAMDNDAHQQVIVLANTRALVRHLRRSLRMWLPLVETVALLGELAHVGDSCFPDEGPLSRIVVTTPERFDLDWRRAVTNDEGAHDPSSSTSLIVADEAHHIADVQRGARLELGLSRARRSGIPIQLFSSQLGGADDLEAWLGGAVSVSSDWRPADVHRSVFFRRKEDKEGWIQQEAGNAELCMTMPGGRIDYANPALAVRSRVNRSAASGLGLGLEARGMVLIYTPQKRSVAGLADEVCCRVQAVNPQWTPPDRLAEIAERLPPAAVETKNFLQLGIGIHHASLSKFEHRAVEEAAEQGLLRYIVCTDTLLSGIDFPVRTVIVTNCLRNRTLLPTAHLNNLAGRAGRGGRFMTGELILMATGEDQAKTIFTRLAQGVPRTKSQLTKAYQVLQRVQDAVNVSEENCQALRELDSFILAAVAEGILEQGDLRIELEEALGATLWWAGAPESRTEQLVVNAARRAKSLAGALPGWNRAVYRTGLDTATCAEIRSFVDGLDTAQFLSLAHEEEFPTINTDLLEEVAMIATLVRASGERWPDDVVDEPSRRNVLQAWLAGANEAEGVPTASLDSAFSALASSGTWIVGSALEILGWRTGMTGEALATVAARLELSRLRTGSPSEAAAQLVDGGLPRKDAGELWRRFMAAPADDFISYAKMELPDDIVALIEWPDKQLSTGDTSQLR